MDAVQSIRERLFALQDLPYRDFSARLTPNLSPEKVIGVRTPALRRLAKELSGTQETEVFLSSLPHTYQEENNLHAFLIETLRDYSACLAAVEAFLPYVDNWATCDQMSPKVFKKHLPELLTPIRRWLASEHTYTIRFGVEMLMSFYLDESFSPQYLDWVADLRSREYYVNMIVAWYFATALAKQYAAALPYLQQRRLDPWTHNKTIQKAVESYRITDEQKTYLRTLREKASRT